MCVDMIIIQGAFDLKLKFEYFSGLCNQILVKYLTNSVENEERCKTLFCKEASFFGTFVDRAKTNIFFCLIIYSLLDKTKKQYRKRKPSEAGSANVEKTSANVTTNKKSAVSPKKSAIARRKSQTFNDSDLESDNENLDELEPVVEASQNIRSWIDQYEEAVTNHYSPELRARLSNSKLNGVGNDLRASVLGGPTRCNVSLKGQYTVL